jgi:hypothetical protein
MRTDLQICTVCRIGRCQQVKAPYLYWVGDQMMIMPNSPALACDICGHVHFEPSFLAHIERLLLELENSIESRRVTQRSMKMEEPVNWHPSRDGR